MIRIQSLIRRWRRHRQDMTTLERWQAWRDAMSAR